MNKKTTCPVCCEQNLETNKTCKNKKCKWDLSFAKNGAFVGLSEDEIERYNKSLLEARARYSELSESEKNKSIIGENSFKMFSELKKDEFENIDDYENRLEEIEYVCIGDYTLIRYDADKEEYEIKITINKNQYQSLKFDFDTLTTLKIKKLEAKKLNNIGQHFPLLAKLTLGMNAKAIHEIYSLNKKARGIFDPFIKSIDLQDNVYYIKSLKFDIANIEIDNDKVLSKVKSLSADVNAMLKSFKNNLSKEKAIAKVELDSNEETVIETAFRGMIELSRDIKSLISRKK